jgi:site-specific recombinase XerD
VTVRRQQLALLGRTLGKPIETATAEDLEAWYADLATRIEPAARGRYLSHASNFYRWMIRQRLRDEDPTARLSQPRLQRRLPRPIADRDLIPALLNAPTRVRPWLLLGLLAGLRACEIAGLRGEDISWDLNMIVIVEGKGGKQRLLPLHPQLASELDLLPRQGWLFPHHDHPKRPVKAWNVSHGVNHYLHSIGVEATFHQFRHRFATDVFAATKDLRLTQELLGHADPRTTAAYTAWDRGAASAAIERLTIPSIGLSVD